MVSRKERENLMNARVAVSIKMGGPLASVSMTHSIVTRTHIASRASGCPRWSCAGPMRRRQVLGLQLTHWRAAKLACCPTGTTCFSSSCIGYCYVPSWLSYDGFRRSFLLNVCCALKVCCSPALLRDIVFHYNLKPTGDTKTSRNPCRSSSRQWTTWSRCWYQYSAVLR